MMEKDPLFQNTVLRKQDDTQHQNKISNITLQKCTLYRRGAQFPGTRSLRQLHFLLWRLILLNPTYGTSIILPLRNLEMAPRFLENFCIPALYKSHNGVKKKRQSIFSKSDLPSTGQAHFRSEFLDW